MTSNEKECDTNEICIEKANCQYYQEEDNKMNIEQNFTTKMNMLKDLRSQVCNYEEQKVCCPDGNW